MQQEKYIPSVKVWPEMPIRLRDLMILIFNRQLGKMIFSVALFSTGLQVTWLAAFACTVILEVLPMSGVPPFLHCLYTMIKGLSFVVFGFAAPLAFWRFDSLGRSVILAVLVTSVVELIQSFIDGHRSNYFELFVKVAFIFIGFVFALHVRFDQGITLGPVVLRCPDQRFL